MPPQNNLNPQPIRPETLRPVAPVSPEALPTPNPLQEQAQPVPVESLGTPVPENAPLAEAIALNNSERPPASVAPEDARQASSTETPSQPAGTEIEAIAATEESVIDNLISAKKINPVGEADQLLEFGRKVGEDPFGLNNKVTEFRQEDDDKLAGAA